MIYIIHIHGNYSISGLGDFVNSVYSRMYFAAVMLRDLWHIYAV